MHLARILSQERIFRSMYVIMVCTERSTEACVHVTGNGEYRADGNIAWQQAVQLVHQLDAINFSVGLKMCRHPTCVYAGICTSCTYNAYRLTQYCGQGFLQFFLHRIAIGLYLPAMIVGSVVCKLYKISTHHFFLLFFSFTLQFLFLLWFCLSKALSMELSLCLQYLKYFRGW